MDSLKECEPIWSNLITKSVKQSHLFNLWCCYFRIRLNCSWESHLSSSNIIMQILNGSENFSENKPLFLLKIIIFLRRDFSCSEKIWAILGFSQNGLRPFNTVLVHSPLCNPIILFFLKNVWQYVILNKLQKD
jgi:hypothetical protein